MANVTIRFLEAASLIGRLITWRLKEPWSHVVILIDNAAYSSQIPFVVMLPVNHRTVDTFHRKGKDFVINCTEDEKNSIKEWCERHVGHWYDLTSIIGWVFGLAWLQSNHRSYCFGFCRKPLVELGWLEPSTDLIKGVRLLQELEEIIARNNNINCLENQQIEYQ